MTDIGANPTKKMENEGNQKGNNSDSCNDQQSEETPKSQEKVFKKPILIGKIGKLPRKIKSTDQEQSQITEVNEDKLESLAEVKQTNKEIISVSANPEKAPAQKLSESEIPLPYKEPEWSGLPVSNSSSYKFEVLKNGSIIEVIDLMERPFFTFGRLPSCNICMQHPTISRYHAVIQFRSKASETEPQGFYVYDLGSTHGTFLNKNRIRPKVFVHMQVGHMLKLGCSTRCYLLSGPDEDREAESEFTVTELKMKRAEELRKRAEEEINAEKEREARLKKEEEKGIDWGIGEDADEDEDLSENPYAQTTNEELYLDDPKKALRGFFEREGLELEYDCSEQGMGQFLCKVELPIDDERGRPIFAEVIHKGKKKEAVVQCALEACRILDRHGLLRQATHESRKRKAKNWEENDYYDSDEDTFLDRTGTVEKKRESRMKAKNPQKAETYESLLEKEKSLSQKIEELEKQLASSQGKLNSEGTANSVEDSLDSFMKDLSQNKSDKYTISKVKLELTKLKKEHANVIRLANIAKPASVPLLPNYGSESSSSKNIKTGFPIIGKRRKIQVKLPEKSSELQVALDTGEDEEEEEENTEDDRRKESKRDSSSECQINGNRIGESDTLSHERKSSNCSVSDILDHDKSTAVIKSLNQELSSSSAVKLVEEAKDEVKNTHQVSDRLSDSTLSESSNSQKESLEASNLIEKLENNTELDEKKRKKNQRRIQARLEKTEKEKLKGYSEDAVREDYSMWVPPQDQTGDGRTSLNDKFGY